MKIIYLLINVILFKKELIDINIKKLLNKKIKYINNFLINKELNKNPKTNKQILSSYKDLPYSYKANTKDIVIKLNNYNFMQVWGNIFLEDLKNPYKVIFDTGSNLLWLASNKCKKCPNKMKKLNCNSKYCEQLNKEFEINYASGYIKGELIKDNLFLKDENRYLELNKFEFINVNESIDLDGLFADGVFGIGFKDELNEITFLQKLYNDNKIDYPYISFLFSKYKNYYGQMIIGGINEYATKLEDIVWKDVIDRNYWAVEIDNIFISDQNIIFNNNIPFLFDTGTSFMLLQDSIYNSIKLFLLSKNKSCEENMDLLICYDNPNTKVNLSYPDLTFKINNKEFTLLPEDYLTYCQIKQKTRICIVMISKFNYSVNIIGLPFLKKFYTIFDSKDRRIGFAYNKLYDPNIVENKFNIYFILLVLILLFCLLYINKYFKNKNIKKRYSSLN